MAVFEEMIADSNKGIQGFGGMTKFRYLLGKKRYDDAYATAKVLVNDMFKDNSMQLNELAWMIVDPKRGPEKKDLDVAMAAAQRSVDLEKGAPNLDTLARVYFLKGDKAKAIELEKEAMAMAPDDEKQAYADTIKEYGG